MVGVLLCTFYSLKHGSSLFCILLVHFRPRNKLKSWLIRHLVASNGDADLMARAIAVKDNGGSINKDRATGKGALGREPSQSERVSRSTSTGKLGSIFFLFCSGGGKFEDWFPVFSKKQRF